MIIAEKAARKDVIFIFLFISFIIIFSHLDLILISKKTSNNEEVLKTYKKIQSFLNELETKVESLEKSVNNELSEISENK